MVNENITTVLLILKQSFPDLELNYNVKRIGVFGSYANNKMSESSDIDLVIDFTSPIGFKFYDLVESLESKLKKKVDVLTTEGVNSIRSQNIKKNIKESIIYVQ